MKHRVECKLTASVLVAVVGTVLETITAEVP